MLKRRFKETIEYIFEGKNWGKILGVLVFFYLFLALTWLNIKIWWEPYTYTNVHPPQTLRWFALIFALLVLLFFLSSIWLKGKVEDLFNRQAKTYFFLSIVLLLFIIVPKLTVWQTISTPWFNFNWIDQYFWHLQILGLAISFSIIVYYWLIEPLSLSKIWILLQKPIVVKLLLWGLFLVGFVLYSILQLSLYFNLGSPMRDVSIFDQAIWHLSRFELPASTVRELTNLWGDHFHPIIAFIAPFYWIKSDVRWLFIIQAAVVSAGVFPIFGIARDKLQSNFAGLAFAFSYIFFLGVQHAIRFGFYPETLAITFLAAAIYFIIKKKLFWYFVFIVLALLCKENISLYVFFLGLWIFLWTKNKTTGLITCILSVAWFLFTVKWLIPSLNHGVYEYFKYDQLGNDYLGVIKTTFLNPLYTFKILFSPDQKINTWLYYLTPFGFLPLFSSFSVVLVPIFGERFLANDPKLYTMGYHYGAGAVTFLTVAAIFGTARLIRLKPIERISGSDQFKIILVSLIIITLTFIYTFKGSEGPLMDLSRQPLKFDFPYEYKNAIAKIDPNASLTAQVTLGTPLAHREAIYLWSEGPGQKKGDYILLSSNYSTFPYSLEQHKNKINSLIRSGEYGIKFVQSDIILFERGLIESQPLSPELAKYLEN